LTKWVNQGANWGEHWAFVKPEMPKVPNKSFFAGIFSWFSTKWEKNDIDYFVKNKLDEEGYLLRNKPKNLFYSVEYA
jgi:hypothetical protein